MKNRIIVILSLLLCSGCTITITPKVEVSQNSVQENNYNNKKEENKISYSDKIAYFRMYNDILGNANYDAAVEVKNNGKANLYLSGARFDVEDSSGHLISTDDFISSCPTVLAPGETGYFYASMGSSLPEGTDINQEYQLKYTLNVLEANEPPTDYVLSDVSLVNQSFGPSVVGRVENNTNEDDSMLYIQGIFYDQEGEIIGITGVNVLDLKAGTTASFELSTMMINDISIEQIADYKLFARKHYYQFN